MNQQPWTSSTQSDLQSNNSVEVRFSPALLTVITMALVLGGIMTCGLMWFLSSQQPASQQNMLRAVGTVVLLIDIGAAIFLRSFLGNSFVRADERGVTQRKGFGGEQFVSWDKIARIEPHTSYGVVGGFTLFDASNNELLRVRPTSKPPLDQSKVVAFINSKVKKVI